MSSRTTKTLAIASVFFLFSSIAKGENDTQNSSILNWDYQSQKSFLITSISMAVAIASQARPDIAECIGKWYTNKQDVREMRYRELLSTIEEYPAHNPTAVVLWVIQNKCGTYKTANS